MGEPGRHRGREVHRGPRKGVDVERLRSGQRELVPDRLDTLGKTLSLAYQNRYDGSLDFGIRWKVKGSPNDGRGDVGEATADESEIPSAPSSVWRDAVRDLFDEFVREREQGYASRGGDFWGATASAQAPVASEKTGAPRRARY